MSNDNTLIIKNSGILFLRLIITSGIGLFTSRFVIRSLGASDYGLYSVVGGVVIMMAFLNTTMTSTTYRYIAFEMGKGSINSVNKVFNISMVIHLCLAFVVLLLTETVGVYYIKHYLVVESDKISDAVFVLRFSTYATIFSIISVPFQGLVAAKENFIIQASIEVLRGIFALGVAISLIYYMGNRIRYYSLLTTIINIVPAFLFFEYCRRKYSDVVKWKFQRDKSKYKEMIGFSGWIMFGAAASMGQTSGSALIINSFFGTLLNAAFGIANQVNSIVLTFARSIGQAAIPQITKSFSRGNTERTISLAAYISKYTTFLMLLPSLPILLETKYLMTLWLGDIPSYTVEFTQLMIINALITLLGGGLNAVVQATGKIKYFQIILSTTSLLSLPIAYVMFKFGYQPSSILFAYISTAVINLIAWQILLKIVIDFDVILFLKISYLKVLYVFILISPIFLVRDLLRDGLMRFLFISVAAIIGLAGSIYFAGLDQREKNVMRLIVIRLFKKIKC